jgi:hypothetical protein
MKKTVCLVFLLATLLALNASAATAETTVQPGLFFTIANNCSTPVSFSAGDELCVLRVGSATFKRILFTGTLFPGQKELTMACTDKGGLGSVMFALAAGSSAPIVLEVKPDQVISIPKAWCGAPPAAPGTLFKLPG